MKAPIITLLVVCVALAASAVDLGNRAPRKTSGTPSALSPINPEAIHQGGDSIDDATVIPGLPFSIAGTTTGFTDDYDEVCPYDGSTSPDVVYSFEPAVDLAIDVDMFGSSYDTKIYVYDENLELVACNDDYYPDYVSLLEAVLLYAGGTYFIVVDGWGGDHGDYVMTVVEDVPCVLACPPGGTPEGEPPLVEDYVDAYNGGCASYDQGYPFQDLYGDSEGNLTFCGVSGWYPLNGMNYRDMDWFNVHVGITGTVEVTVDAEFPTYLGEHAPHDCNIPSVVQQITFGDCQPGSMTVEGLPGSVIWLWIAPTTFLGPEPVFEYDYVCRLSGLASGAVHLESISWTEVKSLFR